MDYPITYIDLMDLAKSKFESGSKELCGAVDLLSQYKLLPHHEIFCKRSLPVSLCETPYLRNVVGDKKIRKGEGMELDQLLRDTSSPEDGRKCLQPFELDILRDAFQITETTTSGRLYVKRAIHLSASELKTGRKNEKKHKRHKDRVAEKGKDPKKQKQHHKQGSMLKENGKDRILITKLHPHQSLKQQSNGLA